MGWAAVGMELLEHTYNGWEQDEDEQEVKGGGDLAESTIFQMKGTRLRRGVCCAEEEPLVRGVPNSDNTVCICLSRQTLCSKDAFDHI